VHGERRLDDGRTEVGVDVVVVGAFAVTTSKRGSLRFAERSSISLASSELVRIGCGSSSSLPCLSVSSSRLPSPPTHDTRLITRSSRMGSIGGFVTCANCCLK